MISRQYMSYSKELRQCIHEVIDGQLFIKPRRTVLICKHIFLHYNLKIYPIYATGGAIAAICPCGYAVLQGTRIDALKA